MIGKSSTLFLVLFSLQNLLSILSCSEFYMNFTNFHISARTLDLGTYANWTITSWPKRKTHDKLKIDPPLAFWPARYGTLGISANWFGDEKYGFPSLFGDSLNEKGLSCSLLMLTDTQYQDYDKNKENIFAGLFCHYVAQNYESVFDLKDALPNIAIWGPDVLAQHFIVRDRSGASLIIECVNKQQNVYLDLNDGVNTFGITTNEPTFDWHLENIKHYEWKRTLSRQAVAVPGNFYPEERFLRIHMLKSGIQDMGLSSSVSDFQRAFALTSEVLNSITVPEGYQYGTDSGDGDSEGSADHTSWGIIRNHDDPTLYWRDATNPTFRRIRLADLNLEIGGDHKAIKLENGPYFIDVTSDMK